MMSSVVCLPKEKYKRLTWKNGLGFTDEIAIYPENADLRRGDFLWRVSSARIEQASPFSTFPEHDRVLVVIRGEGVRLTHTFEEGAEDSIDLRPFSPYEFPGDVPSRCELLAGPIVDLSVFVRKGRVEAQVETVELGSGDRFEWQPLGNWNFAFAAAGEFECEGARVSEGDCIRFDSRAGAEQGAHVMTARSLGRLVLISLASQI